MDFVVLVKRETKGWVEKNTAAQICLFDQMKCLFGLEKTGYHRIGLINKRYNIEKYLIMKVPWHDASNGAETFGMPFLEPTPEGLLYGNQERDNVMQYCLYWFVLGLVGSDKLLHLRQDTVGCKVISYPERGIIYNKKGAKSIPAVVVKKHCLEPSTYVKKKVPVYKTYLDDVIKEWLTCWRDETDRECVGMGDEADRCWLLSQWSAMRLRRILEKEIKHIDVGLTWLVGKLAQRMLELQEEHFPE